MVVDDDSTILRLVELVLHRLHCTVVTVDEPAEAMEMLASVNPDLIILDQMMPRVNGFELCRHIRSYAPTARTPVIMLSALYDPASIAKGLEAGANVYVSKSALHSDLIKHVRKLLNIDNNLDAKAI
jgi:CheY-like chemotaxis protein